jgi:hypothetical protein
MWAEALETLQLVAKRARKTSDTSAAPCSSFYDVAGAPDQLSFGWGFKEEENSRFISFDVITMDGVENCWVRKTFPSPWRRTDRILFPTCFKRRVRIEE